MTETSNRRKTHLHTTAWTVFECVGIFPSYYYLTTCRTRTKQMCSEHAIKHCADFPICVAPLSRGCPRILRFQSNSVRTGRRSPQSSFNHVAFIWQPSCWLYKETSFKSKAPGDPWGGGAGNLFLIDVYTIKAERCLHWVIGEPDFILPLMKPVAWSCGCAGKIVKEQCLHHRMKWLCGMTPCATDTAGEYVAPYEPLTMQHQGVKTVSTIWEPLGHGNLEQDGFYETKCTVQELQWEFGSNTLSETNKSWHESIKSEEKPLCNSSKPKKVRRGIQMLLIECSSEFITHCDLN